RYFEREIKARKRITAPRDIAQLVRTCIPAISRECLVLLCLDEVLLEMGIRFIDHLIVAPESSMSRR
ncbi:MAG: hypothetical protein PHO37_09500, partial [Kiritimatiellae bacterium]|nr:hypothetical protein [Kiritimatiellia bacterium]